MGAYRRTQIGRLLTLVVVALVVLAAWYVLACLRAPNMLALQHSCVVNVRQLALATLAYAEEWDQRLPPAPKYPAFGTLTEGKPKTDPPELSGYLPADDWRRRISPFQPQLLVCPSTGSIYSYDFNARLYGLRLSQARDAATVLEYEAGFVTGDPPGPHNKGYNVSFCDGHGKWLRVLGTPGQDMTLDGR